MRDIRQTVWYWREREEGILMLLESHALLYNMYASRELFCLQGAVCHVRQ